MNEFILVVLLFFGVVFTSAINTSNSDAMGDVLDGAFAKLKASFYASGPTGSYTFYRYDWSLVRKGDSITAIPSEKNMIVPADAILINGRFPVKARGATFFVANRKDKTEAPFVRAAVVVLGDELTEWKPFDKENFSIRFYDNVNTKKSLECCKIYDEVHKGNHSIYYIKCGIIW